MGKILITIGLLFAQNSLASTCFELFKPTTLDFYNTNAEEYNETRAHVSPEFQIQRDTFLKQLKKNGYILEIGAGHGRDALYFKELGFRVLATEPAAELAKIAESKIKEPVLLLTAQEITFKNEFDGIWAAASLIHVPINELPAVFVKLRDALKSGGVIHASFLKGVGKEDFAEQIEDGRFFNRVGEKTLREIIAKIPGLEIDETLTNGHKNDYFGKLAPTQEFGFFNLVLRKTK